MYGSFPFVRVIVEFEPLRLDMFELDLEVGSSSCDQVLLLFGVRGVFRLRLILQQEVVSVRKGLLDDQLPCVQFLFELLEEKEEGRLFLIILFIR